MVKRAARVIALVLALGISSGCVHSIRVPKVTFHVESMSLPVLPGDPVFVGPGSSGPVWSPPEVISPSACGDPCGSCCGPSTPLEPFDPFGWLRVGDLGTQQIDPVGWIFGI